jgi:hypothetical protein
MQTALLNVGYLKIIFMDKDIRRCATITTFFDSNRGGIQSYWECSPEFAICFPPSDVTRTLEVSGGMSS